MWTESDEIWWAAWVRNEDELFRFGEDPDPDSDLIIFQRFPVLIILLFPNGTGKQGNIKHKKYIFI